MTALNDSQLHASPHRDESNLGTPAWIDSLLQPAFPKEIRTDDGYCISVQTGRHATLASFRLRDAVHLSADQLESRAIEIYRILRKTLEKSPHHWPVRIWNYLPSIHEQLEASRDRYMVFNSGRFKAFCEWWGRPDEIPQHVPTASGVGQRGTDLVIHCLATEQSGIAIENPRQIPSFGYSKRYGPQPPCFARATLMNIDRPGAGSLLLVGGTASIRGEQTVHIGDLAQQTNETFTNLAALVIDAAGRVSGSQLSENSALAKFNSLRVYHPNLAERDWIRESIESRFPAIQEIEILRADLCRSELLIEVEGVANL